MDESLEEAAIPWGAELARRRRREDMNSQQNGIHVQSLYPCNFAQCRCLSLAELLGGDSQLRCGDAEVPRLGFTMDGVFNSHQ